MGAEVSGVSIDVPTEPSLFKALDLSNRVNHFQGDVRDLPFLKDVLGQVRPDFVFHLAAQAIVSVSYSDPVYTISTNIIGTANILEALREYEDECTAIMITSDKSYDNVEWVWGYRETDRLGGKDIYSGSKGGAELIIQSYLQSLFSSKSNIRIGIGRAGNVIGGGDWAKDRIVADCMRNWSAGNQVEIRSPDATRPWQHVLEPLSGYLLLAERLTIDSRLHGEAFNFGPRFTRNHTVLDLLNDLSRSWGHKRPEDAYIVTDNIPFKEAGLLKLNCDKALSELSWEAVLDYADTVRFVGDWYSRFYKEDVDIWDLTQEQLTEYEQLASERNLVWV